MNSSAISVSASDHSLRKAASPISAVERLVAVQEFLDLDRIIGHRLGRGVDRGQAAADHHGRQAQLQVGDGIRLRRTGELQGHQEIRGHAHAAGQAVRQVEQGRLAGAERQRDMIEAQLEGLIER